MITASTSTIVQTVSRCIVARRCSTGTASTVCATPAASTRWAKASAPAGVVRSPTPMAMTPGARASTSPPSRGASAPATQRSGAPSAVAVVVEQLRPPEAWVVPVDRPQDRCLAAPGRHRRVRSTAGRSPTTSDESRVNSRFGSGGTTNSCGPASRATIVRRACACSGSRSSSSWDRPAVSTSASATGPSVPEMLRRAGRPAVGRPPAARRRRRSARPALPGSPASPPAGPSSEQHLDAALPQRRGERVVLLPAPAPATGCRRTAARRCSAGVSRLSSSPGPVQQDGAQPTDLGVDPERDRAGIGPWRRRDLRRSPPGRRSALGATVAIGAASTFSGIANASTSVSACGRSCWHSVFSSAPSALAVVAEK